MGKKYKGIYHILTLIFFLQNYNVAALKSNGNSDILQKFNFKFDHYNTDNGLSQNSIYTIIQDYKGFLWFGTQNGINRFNGIEFTHYVSNSFDSTTLPHSYVNLIFEDSKKRMWVCTEGGLSLFNPLTELFNNFVHDNLNRKSLPDNYVHTIFEDSKGNFWVGTKNGLSKFYPENGSFDPVTFKIHNKIVYPEKVTNVTEERNGNLWIISKGGGIFRIKNKNNNSSNKNILADHYSPGNGAVRTVIEDFSGQIILGTFGDGLYKFDNDQNVFIHMPLIISGSGTVNPNYIKTIFQTLALPSVLWLGTEEDGLIMADLSLNTSVKILNDPKYPESLNGTMIYSIYEDLSGLIWIGTNEGINLLNVNSNNFEHVQIEKDKSNGLSSNIIGKFFEDKNRILWIGTDGGGLNKFDRNTNTYTNYLYNKKNPASVSSNRAMIVFEDHSENIWVGTYGGGLNKFNRITGKFKSFKHDKNNTNSISSDYITSIAEDKNGILWIGTTEGGLNRFDPITNNFQYFLNNVNDKESLSDNHIWVLYIDKSDVLWAGTKNGGLNKLIDSKNGKFKRYIHDKRNLNSIDNNTVFEIYEDRYNGFWIGTLGGLNKLDRETEIFNHFRIGKEYSDFSIVGIMEDEHDNLWLMTGGAVLKYNPHKKKLKAYDKKNGLNVTDFRIWSSYKNRFGEMFVGGSNGFAVFHPDSLKDNAFIPPVYIDKFERFNVDSLSGKAIVEKGIIYKDKLELSYKDNIFSFSFAALNYINPRMNKYKYKLAGFNKEWIDIGTQSKITFTNIDAGKYYFMVKGSNDEGIWNEKESSVMIIIKPPFWQTWWFRICIVLILILIIGFSIRNKLKEIQRRQKEQEDFARKLIETEELERRRIANELHDSLGQNLLVIKNFLLVKQQQEFINGKSLEETSELVSHSIHEVRAISHNLRPHLLDQLGLTKTIKSLAKQVSESSGIEINFQVDDLSEALEANAEINLFRIIQECFNNIIKHSGASNADLIIKRSPVSLNILIKDNGTGMNIEEIKRNEEFGNGFGLYGIKKRAHVFAWKYEITSAINKGTEINLIVPLNKES